MTYRKIKFIDFLPTDSLKLRAEALIQQILELTPDDSATHSEIKKRNAYYTCLIEIKSAGIFFRAFCESADPHRALDSAKRRLMWQISKWRSRRFLVPSLA